MSPEDMRKATRYGLVDPLELAIQSSSFAATLALAASLAQANALDEDLPPESVAPTLPIEDDAVRLAS